MRQIYRQLLIVTVLLLAIEPYSSLAGELPLRIGIIGCDTSHAVEFTKIFNRPEAQGDLAGFKVVAAFPVGSNDIADSRNRIGPLTKELQQQGVEIVDSIAQLLTRVDVVLIESVNGRQHLQQARSVIEAGKPFFIDKPVAASLSDVCEIYQLAEQHHVPCFSSSSLRFSPDVIRLKQDPHVGAILGCDAYSPCDLEPHHPDLFWYGIHGVELLYTLMGPGCQTVTRVHTDNADIVVGVWKDGRVGTYRGVRGSAAHQYGAMVFGSKGDVAGGGFGGYEPLVQEIAHFFRTHQSPVSVADTLEIYAFMAAAQESSRQAGQSVNVPEILRRAQTETSQSSQDAVPASTSEKR